jgi:hypothetical protein
MTVPLSNSTAPRFEIDLSVCLASTTVSSSVMLSVDWIEVMHSFFKTHQTVD